MQVEWLYYSVRFCGVWASHVHLRIVESVIQTLLSADSWWSCILTHGPELSILLSSAKLVKSRVVFFSKKIMVDEVLSFVLPALWNFVTQECGSKYLIGVIR